MAGLTASARNVIVAALGTATTHIGLLNTAGVELAGGAPAYARKAVAWSAAAAGIETNTGALTFEVPAATAVGFYGLYSALTAGTNYAILPVQGAAAALPFAATFDNTPDVFTSPAHGLVDGDRVVLADVGGAGLATGFDEVTVYYVAAATVNTFQLSLTLGGAAIVVAVSFEAFVLRTVPEAFSTQGQFMIPVGSLALDANLF